MRGHRATIDQVPRGTTQTITAINRTTRVLGTSHKEREREEHGHEEGGPISVRLLPTVIVVCAGTDRLWGDEGNNRRILIVVCCF